MALIDDILGSVDSISKSLNQNILIVEARKDILKGLRGSGVSKEERDRLYANFAEQLALGLVAQAMGLAKEMPLLEEQKAKLSKEIEVEEQQKNKLAKEIAILEIQRGKLEDKLSKELAILDSQKAKLSKEIEVEEQQKNKLAKEIAILEIQRGKLEDKLSKELAILESQNKGFKKDMYYKIAKIHSENSAMLAQADIETPAWMVEDIKQAISLMSEGEITH